MSDGPIAFTLRITRQPSSGEKLRRQSADILHAELARIAHMIDLQGISPQMDNSASGAFSVHDLRQLVREVLSEKENLVPDQFPLRQTALVRCGRPCGMQFELLGPRNVRLSAVWAADRNTVYFYDARGERFHKQQLSQPVAVF